MFSVLNFIVKSCMPLAKLAIKSPITSSLNMILFTGAENMQHKDDQNLLCKDGGVIALKHDTVRNSNGIMFAMACSDAFSVVHALFGSLNEWRLNNAGNDESNDAPNNDGAEDENSQPYSSLSFSWIRVSSCTLLLLLSNDDDNDV